MPASDHKRRLTAFVVAMAVLIATPLAVVATTEFTDVPDSSVHHDNIDWLKNAGVTSGCNPPDNDEYCPTDSVTRAQMATFMRNLAENQVVDAGSLEGNEASAFVQKGEADSVSSGMTANEPGTASTNIDDFDDMTNFPTSYASVTLDVPDDGYLLLNASTYFNTDHANGAISDIPRASISSSGTVHNFDAFQLCNWEGALPTGLYRCSISLVAVVPVNAGSHTYHLVADAFSQSQADANELARRTLSATYLPTAYGTVVANAGLASESPDTEEGR